MKIKNAHNSLKNRIIMKNLYTNTDNVLLIKFSNKSIHPNFQINGAKRDLPYLNFYATHL